MKVRQFLAELQSRGVYRVAAIYSAGAWALLQVADVIFPIVGLPDGAITTVLLTAAAGFPVAVLLSWLFDLTPQGIVEAPPVAASPARVSWTSTRIIELTLIVLLTVLVGYLYVGRLTDRQADTQSGEAQPSAARASIAVMPFVNMSSMERMGYLGDGLAEEILNLLAKLNELQVAARTSSFYFKDKDVDIATIGEHLGVDHVLEGSVRHDDGMVRVTAQLIDVNNGYHLWSETYDRELQNVLPLQDEIASKIVDTLQVLLSTNSRNALSRSQTLDPATYDYYLQGKAFLRMPPDAASLESALTMFEKSVESDPGFADAFAGLCDSLLGLYNIDLDMAKFRQAEAACQHALVLDRRAAPVYIALGNLYLSSGQYDQAITEFNTAISLSNSPADAYLGLANTYVQNNEPELAQQAYQSAIDLQPNYWKAYMSMGNYLFAAGQVAEAIPYYRRITELMPQSEMALNNLGVALFYFGDFEQASQAWQESLDLAPSSTAYSNVATTRYFSGRFDEAVELYHMAVEFAPDDYELWGNLGDAYRQIPGGAELANPMYNNAIKLASKRLQVNASDTDALIQMGHYEAVVGDPSQAIEYIDRAFELAPEDMYVNYTAAIAFTTLAEFTRALDALERALALGYPRHVARADAGLRGLQNMPRYEALTVRRE